MYYARKAAFLLLKMANADQKHNDSGTDGGPQFIQIKRFAGKGGAESVNDSL